MPHPDEGTIHSWLDGALPSEEAARIESHVAGCPQCQAAVAEARGKFRRPRVRSLASVVVNGIWLPPFI